MRSALWDWMGGATAVAASAGLAACSSTAMDDPFFDDGGSGADAAPAPSPGSDAGRQADASAPPPDSAVAETAASDGPTNGAVCDAPNTIFTPNCEGGGCHNATDKANQLDLASPGLAARLIDHMAVGGSGKLIDSSNPAQSVLLLKLTANPPFGAQMPFLRSPLSAAQTQCVHDWVFAQVSPTGGG
jgi:hypothetical protein